MKNLSYNDILVVLDKEIKATMERKNKYIERNGYKGVDRFNTQIATLSGLYSVFKEACNEDN